VLLFANSLSLQLIYLFSLSHSLLHHLTTKQKYYYNINDFALNPTLDATYTLLDEVIGDLATAMEGLPPATLHLGGDEVIYGCWANDSSIVDWMAVNGTQYGIAPGDFDALLSYFVSKAQALAANHGFNRPMQWEEVFKAGCDVSANTIYQVWTGAEYVGECTAANYAVVASPSSYWYLDHADNTASVMYDYDPSADLSSAQQALLLGGEVNMWGEHVDAHNHDAITWPRASAVAERLWSSSQVLEHLHLMHDKLLVQCLSVFPNQIDEAKTRGHKRLLPLLLPLYSFM